MKDKDTTDKHTQHTAEETCSWCSCCDWDQVRS